MLASQGSRLDSRAGFTVWKLNHEAERHPIPGSGPQLHRREADYWWWQAPAEDAHSTAGGWYLARR